MTEMLFGRRVLVVEDESLVVMMIEDMLHDLGCEVVATVGRLAEARRLALDIGVDLAILDVNLNGEPVFPVAETLRKRSIPIVFSTGYGASALTPDFLGFPVLAKPYAIVDLQRALVAALG